MNIVEERYLVVFGGYEVHRLYNDLRVFDTLSRQWSGIPSRAASPAHRYAHSSVVVEDSLYVFGGMDRHQPLNDLWRFSFESLEWTQIKYSGIVSPLFRSAATEVEDGFLLIGGAKSS